MMMDVYHPDFHNGYFAIDSRIERLLPKLGYSGHKKYEMQEAFLVERASELGMDCWDLDRLLYNYEGEIVARLQSLR